MKWDVQFTRIAAKQAAMLSEKMFSALQLLVDNLKTHGPAPGKQWRHYGKLQGKKQRDKRHCYLNSGSPTYVCCWEVYKYENIIEVYYVGSHEKAPY